MKKIVISSYDSINNPFYNGGGAAAIHEIAKRLAKTYDMTVLSAGYPGSIDEVIDGVRYRRIHSISDNPRLGQLLFHLALRLRIRNEQFDLWIENFTPPFSTSLVPRLTQKPVIALVHMLSATDMQHKYKLPFTLIENWGLKSYQHVISVTEASKEKILERNPQAEVTVIPNGVTVPRHPITPVPDGPILFLGRIEMNQKGLDLLLNSFSAIKDSISNTLVIAGSGTQKELSGLTRMLQKLQLTDRVTLLGYVSGSEKDRLLRSASCLVVPSRYETFSITALEALAYGLPLITFDIEGLQWIPSSVRLIAKPRTEQGLSSALVTLQNDNAFRKELSMRGRLFAKNFSWDIAAKKYGEVINQLIGHPKTTRTRNILSDIVDEKIPCYFISPHLDDAILSAGGLISYLAGKTSVSVISVFTKGDSQPYSLSERAFLHQIGYADFDRLYAKRRQENKKVLEMLGINNYDLSQIDSLCRKKSTKRNFIGNIGQIIPELNRVYPFYRIHSVSGKISAQDRTLMENITNQISGILSASMKSIIFCPLGIGRHVDHVIVRDICLKIHPDAIFWSDFPYLIKSRPDLRFINRHGLTSFDFSGNMTEKEKLILGYRSQIKPLFKNRKIPLISERYYFHEQKVLASSKEIERGMV